MIERRSAGSPAYPGEPVFFACGGKLVKQTGVCCGRGGIGEKGALFAVGSGCARGAGDVRDGGKQTGVCSGAAAASAKRAYCLRWEADVRAGREMCEMEGNRPGFVLARRRHRRKGRIDCGGKRVCARGGRCARCGETDRGLLRARRRHRRKGRIDCGGRRARAGREMCAMWRNRPGFAVARRRRRLGTSGSVCERKSGSPA